MVDGKDSKKRWYDQQATVSKSVTLIESFPVEFQVILGESILSLAENHCQVKELMAELKSLGPEKVLSLFKSKSKRRSYDNQQELHQAMNYLYVLPDESRIYIATHIIALTNYFYEYFKICKEGGVQPSANIARQVSKAYLEGDLHDPNIFLTVVRKHIEVSNHYSFEYTNQPNPEDTANPVEKATKTSVYDEKLASDRQGMKISLEKIE